MTIGNLELKKYLISAACIIISATWISAGATFISTDTISIRRAFLEMPNDMIDLLPVSTRMDMLDYYAIDSIWHAPNAMEGTSYIKKGTDSFMEIQLTQVSLIQIKILPYRGGNIVAAAYTIESANNSDDTELRFFSSSMKPIPNNEVFEEPRLRDFFNFPKDGLSSHEIEMLVPFPTVRYDLSPNTNDMTASLTVKEYLGKEDYAKISPYLKDRLYYIWNSKKYVLDKKKNEK